MNAESEINLAYRLFAQKDFQGAAQRARQVLLKSPQDPAAMTLIGRLALMHGDPLLAQHSFQQVLQKHQDIAALWLDLARALRDLGRHLEALKATHQAMNLNSGDVETLVLAGEIHLVLGEKPEAALLFRGALEVDSRCVAAYRGLCMSEDLDPDSEEVKRMVALSSSDDLGLSETARLHYSLAQIYCRSGARRKFFEHLFAANAEQRRLCPDAREEYADHFDRIETAIGVNAVEKVVRTSPISPAPIFIVGMPRSGTTLVERIISGHPEVAAGGEIDYMRGPLRHGFEKSTGRPFPLDFEQVPENEINELVAAYERRLAIIGPGCRYVTDKTPGNFHLLGLLHVLFTGGKIIHVKRDPLDTCFSILQFPFDDRSPHTCDIELLAYVYGRYVRLMKHWKMLFGEFFLTVEYEKLVNSPATESQRIFEYCELDWQEKYLDVQRTGGAIRTFSATQARLPIYQSSVGAADLYREELGPLRDALNGELSVI